MIFTCTLFSALLSLASATGARHDSSRSMTTAQLIAATRSSVPLHAPDPAFDCGWRLLALNYSAFIQPWLTPPQLQYVADALEIARLNCDAAGAAAALIASHAPAGRGGGGGAAAAALPAAPAAASLYVDFAKGSDANDGSLAAPLKTVAAAVARARAGGDAAHTAIVLRNGTHFLADTITLGAADSGLSFAAFPGEAPTISGAVPLPGLQWRRVSGGAAAAAAAAAAAPGPVLPGTNNVFGQCGKSGVPNKGVMVNWQACQASCLADAGCTSWTFMDGAGFGPFSNVCCWRTDGKWDTRAEANTFSQNVSSPPAPAPSPPPSPSPAPATWAAPLPAGALPPRLAAGALPALQVGGHRATLARFPNANSELDIFPAGYITAATWLRPAPGPIADETVNEALPAGAEDGGAGMYINYTVGLGGLAKRYSPPQSFWASAAFSPHYRWNEMHLRSPSGLDYGGSLPRAPYARLDHAVVHTWREHHWFSWMFGVGAQNGSTAWAFNAGGHQGGEGCDVAAEWWVEGVKEELDAVNEFFYDEAAGVLYFIPNASDASGPGGAPPADAFAAPALSTFFNLSGSPGAPVAGVSFSGIAFTGGAPTFMDARGVPSGGDWALERNGALLLEGTAGVSITDCAFDRIDGNAIFLSGWNRGAVVARNEFSNLGQSAVAAWGRTAEGAGGWDGSALEVPLNCSITGNVAHDLGQIQKQSSFYFQAVAALNTIAENIVYNIPRCAVNFDDSFGGGTVLAKNLFFNTCRESSDHGAFNSWSRMPYATTLRDGKTLSAIPAFIVAERNFIVANYAADGGCLCALARARNPPPPPHTHT
jgi:hypothetical protein